MNKLAAATVFAIMVLGQWFVPGNMIFQEEKVLEQGVAYKFRTQPIDPSDPFRGKYVRLSYEMRSLESDSLVCNYGTKLYVTLGVDSLGFAKAEKIGLERPSTGDFVIADCAGYYGSVQHFNLPFDTFYMNEDKALKAEIAVREVQRDTLPTVCYGVVHILEDRAVLSDVQIDGVSLKDYVDEP